MIIFDIAGVANMHIVVIVYVARFGQAFAKCEGSPQTKHLLTTSSPVALTKFPSPLPPLSLLLFVRFTLLLPFPSPLVPPRFLPALALAV